VSERRKYRFRVWDKQERALYPVIMVGRGIVMIKDSISERSRRLSEVTLMQFAGLLDVKGHEIYEGDVVTTEEGGSKTHKQVLLEDGAFRLKSLANEQEPPQLLSRDIVLESQVKVVGNIYADRLSKDIPQKSV